MMNPFEQLRILLPAPEHHFEEAASHILRNTVKDARRVRVHRGDEGVDTFTGTWGETGELEVYQIKYFADQWGPSQKQQIEDSFRRSAENTNYNLKRWFLVVPTNPTAKDYKWLHEWSARQQIEIEIVDGSELSDRLRQPQCGGARELLQKWGVMGMSGGAFLIPSLKIGHTPHIPTVLMLDLTNRGDRTARGIRVVISHSETHTVSWNAPEPWNDDGNGTLNPRILRSGRNLNPGEGVTLLQIPFQTKPEMPVEISVKITAVDTLPTTFIGCVLPDSAVTGTIVPLTVPSTPLTIDMPPMPVGLSVAASDILEELKKTENLREPALHIIDEPHPADPTQKLFFLAEGDTSNSTQLFGMKIRLLQAAVQELLETGHLHEPVDGPGTTVYEFKI